MVRFVSFETVTTGTRAFEYFFNSFNSVLVHERRIIFLDLVFIAVILPSVTSLALLQHPFHNVLRVAERHARKFGEESSFAFII